MPRNTFEANYYAEPEGPNVRRSYRPTTRAGARTAYRDWQTSSMKRFGSKVFGGSEGRTVGKGGRKHRSK